MISGKRFAFQSYKSHGGLLKPINCLGPELVSLDVFLQFVIVAVFITIFEF